MNAGKWWADKLMKIMLWETTVGTSYHIFMDSTSTAFNVSYAISLYNYVSEYIWVNKALSVSFKSVPGACRG